MSPALRFLALAVVGWVGLRAAMLGALPGGELFRFDASKSPGPPPVVETQFAQPEPLMPAPPPGAQWVLAAAPGAVSPGQVIN